MYYGNNEAISGVSFERGSKGLDMILKRTGNNYAGGTTTAKVTHKGGAGSNGPSVFVGGIPGVTQAANSYSTASGKVN